MTPAAAVESAGYLLLGTSPTTVALPMACMLDVVRAADWVGELPPALDVLAPLCFVATDPAWVVRIGGSGQSMATVVRGRLRLEYLRTDELLKMPRLPKSGFELYSNVILAKGRPTALAIDIDALVHMHRELDLQSWDSRV
jgi:hypothetical protein